MPTEYANIVHVATECTPFYKTGGLADVIGSLPQALKSSGDDLTVILPKFKQLPKQWSDQLTEIATLTVWVKWRKHLCSVYRLNHQDICYLFFDNPYYFHRDRLYGCDDDAERFAFFSHAVLEWLDQLEIKPVILHCHDWQTGLLPAYIRSKQWNHQIKTVFSIHNLAYQGQFPDSVFYELLHFDEQAYSILEMDGRINYLKSGVAEADKVTTVSPSYALEIQQPRYGQRLDALLRQRSDDLTGIINGIDLVAYNPKTDKDLVHPYQIRNDATEINKRSLQVEAGLSMSISTPLLAIVSRLVPEKGIDLLVETLHALLPQERVQMIVLGSGTHELEEKLFLLQHLYPSKLIFFHEFDEAKARRLYAGADMLLMPSLFEPCGLSQLIALRYGCVPIVRETGGLKDTIQNFNPYTGTGNGFTFNNMSAGEFYTVILKALSMFKNKQLWDKIILNGRSSKLDWTFSASLYHRLYEELGYRKEGKRLYAVQSKAIQRETVEPIS
ncbi:glycogen synthase [Alkalicoccobacillus porphyridii]|uniref:Glycogen synthase n=1 Tax=Alkalicoccobacillus porphyridii TaxID=2597270 RepID=A0A553ZWL4_9BACI|nr:glycogen/starch synthase [Alkalicoccobacillus porphyridii]TSB45822.1 glycogen synthase [Alkalicoccobacillus porphyridii]